MIYQNEWTVTADNRTIESNPLVREIALASGLEAPTAQLLVNRGCDSVEAAMRFLGMEEEQLHDPFLMKDVREAALRIKKAIETGEKTVIFGDYDVDGITSVSMLYLWLESRGADVSYYIPSRAGDGYGMSEGAVRKLAEAGNRLIITVDTGVTAINEIKLAYSLGMEVIVTDHHECRPELPECEAVVNPRRPDCCYPFKELAGVGVIYKVICAAESLLSPEKPLIETVRYISGQYCDLVALGTVADVMPVTDENRLIVAYGLTLLDKTTRPGLVELIEAAKAESKSKRKTTASFIGFTIAPRLNAAGRLSDASISAKLILSSSRTEAEPLAAKLCSINRERQNEENKIADTAYALIESKQDFLKDPVIILDDPTWHHGVIGIVASRMTEHYYAPSILISFEGSDPESDEALGKGSGRSIKGFNLVEALENCSDLLEKYGGHEQAAGLTIKRRNLPEFRERMNRLAREAFGDERRKPVIEADCELIPDNITMKQASELYRLEPFGTANPNPVFVTYSLKISDIRVMGEGGKHSRITLSVPGTKRFFTAVFFRKAPKILDLYPGDTVDLMYNLDVNEFNNTTSVQLVLKDIRLSEPQNRLENDEEALYKRLKAGETQNELNLTDTAIAEIVPTRDDFALVYSLLKKELSFSHELFSIRSIESLIKNAGGRIGFIKLKFILMILKELRLLNIDKPVPDMETYRIGMVTVTGKADLNSSRIYRKLKAAFGID